MGSVFSSPYVYKPINKLATGGLTGGGRKRVSRSAARKKKKNIKETSEKLLSLVAQIMHDDSEKQGTMKGAKWPKTYLATVKPSNIPNGKVPFKKITTIVFIPRGFSFRGRFYELPTPGWKEAFERFIQILRDKNTPGLDTIDPKYLGVSLKAGLSDQVNYAYCFRNVTRILKINRKKFYFHV